jgi:hypothetical protein
VALAPLCGVGVDVEEAPRERLSFQMTEGKEGGRAKATLRREGRRSLVVSSPPRRCCIGGGGSGKEGGEEVDDTEDGSVVMVRRVSPPWESP